MYKIPHIMIRMPVVAGQFYPASKKHLSHMLDTLIAHSQKQIDAIAAIIPHAGYLYSGKTAGIVYGNIKPPKTAIIISPNHTGLGHPISLHPADEWQTPLGNVQIDKEIIKIIKEKMHGAKLDELSQLKEHALEVHLPFLQKINPEIKIVPITLGHLLVEETLALGEFLGELIYHAETIEGDRPLIIASSDMTHFETAKRAEIDDKLALNEIFKLRPDVLIDTVSLNNISMCGVYPAAVAIQATKTYASLKNIKAKAELLDYTNSGFVTKDFESVVAYAGVVFY